MANWDGGQLITQFQAGQTWTCTKLVQGQIYAVVLYNVDQTDTPVTVLVTGPNSAGPQPVSVPGTTSGQGLASVVLVSGNDGDTVSIAMSSSEQGTLSAVLVSAAMPIDTQGINNQQLPVTGQPQPFSNNNRYFAVPASTANDVIIKSDIFQFISLEFSESTATVNIVNPSPTPSASVTAMGSVTLDGTTPGAIYKVRLAPSSSPQQIQYFIFGNGQQIVWFNADSPQDAQNATISLQQL